jgi:uncharacterized protein
MKAKKKDQNSASTSANNVNGAIATGSAPLSIFQRLFKKPENVFIKLIIQQAVLTLEGLNALNSYMENQGQPAAAQLTAREKEADEVRRILINEINNTFITPFDREDIFTLSRTIDDVLDYAYSTVTEMELFKVKPTPYMQTMAKLLRDAANELMLAVMRMQQHGGVASDHVRTAKSLENKIEEVYRVALADLFMDVNDVKQVVKVMKLREVYRHLSNAGDRVDEAANVIADIVVKSM